MTSPKLMRAYLAGPSGQIHVRLALPDEATALPLLCFHLSPVSGVIYQRFLGEIGRDRLVVAPDTPGYGMSDPPATPPDIGTYADAMVAVLDAMAIPRANLMGYHTGSKIAVELALRHPERIDRLILVSAPVYVEAELASQKVDFRPMPVDEDGEHLVRPWRALRRWAGPGQTPDLAMEQFPDHLRGGERRGWGHAAAFAYLHAEALPKLNRPVLVLNPDDDLTAPTSRVGPYLNQGRLQSLPGWGHGFMDVRTADAGALVRAFLDAPEPLTAPLPFGVPG